MVTAQNIASIIAAGTFNINNPINVQPKIINDEYIVPLILDNKSHTSLRYFVGIITFILSGVSLKSSNKKNPTINPSQNVPSPDIIFDTVLVIHETILVASNSEAISVTFFMIAVLVDVKSIPSIVKSLIHFSVSLVILPKFTV